MPPLGGTRTSLVGKATAAFQPSWGMFSPGLPPTPPDPRPVRSFDFPAGQNLQFTPRSYEPFGFPALRSFANVELVRLAIETRKDQVERLDFRVKPREGVRRPRRHDADDRIRKIERMLRKPDGATHFATWMRLILEDVLVLDAPTVERRRNRNGDIIGLDVVDGATIKLLVDDNGRRPLAPLPAFQQVIKGRIWNDLSSDDIIYAPRNLRPGHIYGFGPVEQVVVTLNTILARQTQQLAYFTDGNLPQGLVNTPEGWQPDQLKDWQEWMDARLSGNLRERSKLMWAPFGSKYQAFKDSPIKDEFDEWLARIICFAFSLPPSPFIKQMNRATAEDADERALEEGRAPLLLWAKRLFDGVIQDDLGHTDLEFAWDIPKEVDPEKQAKVDETYVKSGVLRINEVRDGLGLDPVPGGNRNLIYTASGAVDITTIGDEPDDTEMKEQPEDAEAGDLMGAEDQ